MFKKSNKKSKMPWQQKVAFLWSYVKPYKKMVIVLIIASVVAAFADAIAPFLFGKMTDTVLGADKLLGLSFWQLIVVWAGFSVIALLIDHISAIYAVDVQTKVASDMTIDFCQHSINLPVAYHYNQKPGAVFKIIDRAANATHNIMDLVVSLFLPNILMVIIALVIMFWTNQLLASIVFITIIIFFIVSLQYKMNQIMENQKQVNKKYNMLFGNIGDMLANIFSVKTNTTEKEEIKDKEKSFIKIIKLVWQQMVYWAQHGILQGLISRASYILIIGLAVYLLAINQLTPGVLVMFVAYLAMVFRPVGILTHNLRWLRRLLVDLEDAARIKKKKEERDDPLAEAIDLQGNIEFKNVNFKYPERDFGILKNINFKIKAGQTLAIFGETGSGKTTAYNLILRLYEPDSGKILFDGIEAKKILQQSLRSQIAVVPQDPSLFNESILDNIKYGKQDAKMSEVIKAAKIADAHNFIKALPKGYKTKVGERGVKLSGGQVQRIVIARAALRDPKILILDEATTSLDQKTKFEVLDALQNLITNRTTIIITHDFSAITQSADKIIVLEDGKIVQQGRHKQLVKQKGIYRDLWQTQQKHLQI